MNAAGSKGPRRTLRPCGASETCDAARWVSRWLLVVSALAFFWLSAFVAESRAEDTVVVSVDAAGPLDADGPAPDTSSTADASTTPSPTDTTLPPDEAITPSPEEPSMGPIDPAPPTEEPAPPPASSRRPRNRSRHRSTRVRPPSSRRPLLLRRCLQSRSLHPSLSLPQEPPRAEPPIASHDLEPSLVALPDPSGSSLVDVLNAVTGGTGVTGVSSPGSSTASSNAGKPAAPQPAHQSPPPSPRTPWPSSVFGTGGAFSGSAGGGGGAGGLAIGLLAALCFFAFAQLLGSRLSTRTTPLRAASAGFQLTRPG